MSSLGERRVRGSGKLCEWRNNLQFRSVPNTFLLRSPIAPLLHFAASIAPLQWRLTEPLGVIVQRLPPPQHSNAAAREHQPYTHFDTAHALHALSFHQARKPPVHTCAILKIQISRRLPSVHRLNEGF